MIISNTFWQVKSYAGIWLWGSPVRTLSRCGKKPLISRGSSLPANPLTYYERYILARTVLTENGVKSQDLSVVPLPINLPERYQHYVPMDAVFFLTMYDDWGRKKLGYFKSLGLKTHVLWEVAPGEKGLSANDIRNYMIHDKPWQHLVPQSVAALLIKWRIPQRLKKIQAICRD